MATRRKQTKTAARAGRSKAAPVNLKAQAKAGTRAKTSTATSAACLCLCGCGRPAKRAFAQGHDMRWRGHLSRIRQGKANPADLLSDAQVKALGPWTDSEDGGKVPARTWRDLIAA